MQKKVFRSSIVYIETNLSYTLPCPVHSSDECKVLGGVGFKYSKLGPTRDCSQEPANNNKFGRQQENNYISQDAVYEIILREKTIKCEI